VKRTVCTHACKDARILGGERHSFGGLTLAEVPDDTEVLSKMITKKSISRLALAALFTTAACSQTPAKAPGSNPEDMTPEGHREAAAQEEQKAAEHEEMKENVGPSKPMTEENQKSGHEQQAEQHKDYAQQHQNAAEAAEKK
jgi:hypothetical protein